MRRTPGKSVIRKLLYIMILVAAALSLCCGTADRPDWMYQRDTLEEWRAYRTDLSLYDGAPLVIPHGIASLGRENCLNCHSPGSIENDDRVALPFAHEDWSNCVQCHVERSVESVFQANNLVPLRWRSAPSDSSGIAPKRIPHHIQNRENCEVCHIGTQSPAALRARHGYRAACLQCHIAGTYQ